MYSLSVLGDILVSSDGMSVIVWNMSTLRMLARTVCCFDDSHIEELLMVDPQNNEGLRRVYQNHILLTRTKQELKVWKYSFML